MCFTFGCDLPTVFNEKVVRARKQHRCCECGRLILPGCRYQTVFGVWEGNAETFRTCLLCYDLRGVVARIERDSGCDANESTPPFTGLMDALRNGGDDGEGHYPPVPEILQNRC